MDIIVPTTDFCAKELFEHELILRYFISDVTKIPLSEIRSVHLCNPYLRKHYRKQKQGIVDVLVELNNDAKINIEVQVESYRYWERRNLFYLSKMYAEDLHAGEDYAKLKKSISINVMDFNVTDAAECHSVYHLRNAEGACFTDLFEIHVIELKKPLTGDRSLDDWVRFFNARREEDLDMILTKNPGINMAITEVKRMSMSDRIRARYEAHLKEVRDRNAREAYVRNEGWERGRTEGLECGRTEGRLQEIFMSVQEGDYSIERGAQKAGMSMDAFKKVMAEAEQSLMKR